MQLKIYNCRMQLKIITVIIDVVRGAKGAMSSPKFLENIVILRFERRFSKKIVLFD